MRKKQSDQGARAEGAEAPEAEGIRVTDRRRVRFWDTSPEEGEGVETGAAEEPAGLKPKYVEELEERTRAAEQKALDVQSRFDQVRAELQRETDDVRRRLNRNADERAAREKAAFLTSLLPVVDNLRRALAAAEAGGSLESLLDGLRGTISGFDSVLVSSGVESVTAVGEQFDPELHEAVDTTEVEPERDGVVTAEYARGYRAGAQLLRPARVQVGRARGGDAQAAGE